MMVTAKTIRELRDEAGLSQACLARLARVSQAHIAKIEAGRVDPRLSTVNRILYVLSHSGRKRSCRSVMSPNIISIGPDEPVIWAINRMRSMEFSQLPVMEGNLQLGSIDESSIVHNMERGIKRLLVRNVMKKPFPVVDARDPVEILPPLLDFHSAVLVAEKGKIKGIITKSNLLGVR
jgi:predicted transcriptional regulator